jgi:hypothetical protein
VVTQTLDANNTLLCAVREGILLFGVGETTPKRRMAPICNADMRFPFPRERTIPTGSGAREAVSYSASDRTEVTKLTTEDYGVYKKDTQQVDVRLV